MFRSRSDAADLIHRMLQELPTSCGVFGLDGAWFVVGPAGLFIITHHGDDPDAACARAVRHAVAVRSQLANELHWIPFIDAIVVANERGPILELQRHDDCTVIPEAALLHTLCDGPSTIDDESLAEITMVGLRRLPSMRDNIGGWPTS